MTELFTPDNILYGIYAAFTSLAFGVFVAAPRPIRGAAFLAAWLWPILLPFWLGTAVRSCLEKYLVS